MIGNATSSSTSSTAGRGSDGPPLRNDPASSPEIEDLAGSVATVVSGRWLPPETQVELPVVDPSTGRIAARIPASSVGQAEQAVTAARRSFRSGVWARMLPAQRSARIRRLAELIDQRVELFAQLGCLEVGTPISVGRTLHGASVVRSFEWWSETALRGPMGGWEESLGMVDGPIPTMSTLFREPLGVVAAISSFNYPMLMASYKLGGALAAGCSVVYQPSPRSPLSAIALMRCIEEAGIPPGVVNLVVGGPKIGKVISTHCDVDLVSFTGSATVGRKVMRQASDGLKRVVLELDGKSPNLVLPGVDLEQVVGPSVLRFLRNSGQGCGATTRTLVPREDYEEYAELTRSFLTSIRIGSAWEDDTDMGPVVSAERRARVERQVGAAIGRGASILAGGGRPAGLEQGYFMNPAVLGSVDNWDAICQEEVFGPVCSVIPYRSLDEAVEIANDTDFGLNANVWGALDAAMAVGRRIRSGTVTLNGGGADLPQFPWNGHKQSGVGAERGLEGFREFLAVSHVQIPLTPPPIL